MVISVKVPVGSAIKDVFTYLVRKNAHANFSVATLVPHLLVVPVVALPVLKTAHSPVLMVHVVQNVMKIVSNVLSHVNGSVSMSNAPCLVVNLAIDNDATNHAPRS